MDLLKDLQATRKIEVPVVRVHEHMSDTSEVVAGHQGMGRPVYSPDINRPGLALAGYLDYFANDCVQVLGNAEIHYMETLPTSVLHDRLENMFAFEIPVFVASRKLRPLPLFLDMCNRRGIPVVQSQLATDEVISDTIIFLANEFAPETVLHGTAVNCFGVGCLITGQPGIGKSEVALELVERGHMLVADDVVTLKRDRENALIAKASPMIEHHMEIRGVGIIDIKSVFGPGSVVNSLPVSLAIHLEEWHENKNYDRTGLTEEYVEVLNVKVPSIIIPVRPGRNIAIILEVAALNHRLKELGYNPAQELNERLLGMMHKVD